MEENKEKGRLDRIEDKLNKITELKTKEKKKIFKLPWKARVGNTKLKKGYLTVEVINENKEIDFVKEPIIDGTVKLNGTFHAVDELDIFTYKGKPFLHQPKTKINPWNPLSAYLNEERTYDGKKIDKNEIYGQKYVMARMKADFILGAKKFGWGAAIFGLVILGVIVYTFMGK